MAPQAARPALAVRAVAKSYGRAAIVREADFALEPGRIACLLGPSGCGKSTLLRLVAGLERADAGEIEVGGRIVDGAGTFVPPEARGIGLVFQDLALFPHLNALENVAFGLRRLPTVERRRRAFALLERFRLAHRAAAWPHSLSGGEQQRVAIARALAPEPTAILLDEPFSGLDGDLRAEVRETVVEALRRSNAAVLIVTHDPEEAMLLGDRLILMSEGRTIQSGTPEQCYFRPGSAAAARLLGPIALVPAAVSGGIARCAFGTFPAEDRPDGPATALLRPEAFCLAPDGVAAEVAGVRFAGAAYEIRLRAGEASALMRVTGAPPAVGAEIRIGILPGRAVLVAD